MTCHFYLSIGHIVTFHSLDYGLRFEKDANLSVTHWLHHIYISSLPQTQDHCIAPLTLSNDADAMKQCIVQKSVSGADDVSTVNGPG